MHRFSATTLVVVIVASLLAPLAVSQAYHEGTPSASDDSDGGTRQLVLESVQFTPPIDTSATVPEYPMISRALMLPGGSTDVALGDVDKDGMDDLIVAVSGPDPAVSVFSCQITGGYLSHPSFNISLDRIPISLAVVDVEGSGEMQISVLERRMNEPDVDMFEIFDFNSTTSSFEKFLSLPRYLTYENATMIVAGNLSGDAGDDIAVLCAGSSPSTSPGYVEVFQGPSYLSPAIFETGLGSNAICIADFDGDDDADLAVSNYHDSSVLVFGQPFSFGMSPDMSIAFDGSPTTLFSGILNGDSTSDLVVCTENPSATHIRFQSGGELPSTDDFSLPLEFLPGDVRVGDLDGDGRDDLLILSEDDNVALGMFQRTTSPIWPSTPDFLFPTGEIPRNSLIADLDGNAVADVAIASARDDWSGSSLALYTSNSPYFSNSNLTMWSNSYYAASAVSVGDLNGDDWDDAVLLYPDLDAFGYSLSFSGSMTTMALGYEPRLMLVADFDGDGWDDVMTTSNDTGDFTLHCGDSTLPDGFTVRQFQYDHNAADACYGDLNDDGLLDLIFATDAGEIEVNFNTGDEVLFDETTVLSVSPGIPIGSVAVGDFDSDGLDDLAFPKGLRTIGIVFQNPSSPNPISLPTDENLTASFDDVFSVVLSGDITGDGRDDIVGVRDGDNDVYLYDQSGFASSVPFGTLALPESPGFVGLFDATDDGHDDIVTILESADLLFLYRQDGGSFPSSPSMTFVTGASPCRAMVGDATQDHRGDLIVCNAESHSLSAWEQVNFPPVADAGGPYTAHQGDPFTFNGSSITGASEIPYMEYRWDLDGDDTWDIEWAREPCPVYTYMSLGEFAITMEIRDPWGLNDTDYTTVSVVDSYPHASFTIEPYPPVEGVTIYFNDTTTSFDTVVNMNWSVDDVLVSSGLVGSIDAVFDNGPHSVSLEATDSDGSVTNHTEAFTVLAVAPEVAISAPLVVDEGSEVVFEVLVDSFASEPWDPIVSYEWNFSYDGEPFVANETTYVNTTSHAFYADGDSEVYSIAVKVTDIDGNSSMAFHDLTVLDIGPDATLTLSTSAPGEGLPFHFVASDSPDGITSWSWSITGPDGYSGVYSLTADEMLAVEFVLADGDYTMSLVVSEADGDEDEFDLDFSVAELPPAVSLSTLPLQSWYYEFDIVTLSASVESYDEAVLYEWDFMASGGEFLADSSTTVNNTEHSYLWAGHYTAKVNVTDSDGSTTIALVTVEIRDRELEGTFDDVVVARGAPPASSTITFNASYFAETYPDLSNVLWEFGDGSELLRTGPPSTPTIHEYDPVRDYQVNITMTDDDGNVLVVSRVLPLLQPMIELISPANNAVVVPGTSIRFSVSDDTIPLEYVRYSLNDGAPANFTTLYEIGTSGWTDGAYTIDVVAKDRDGNVAVLDGIVVTVDSVAPEITLLTASNFTHAGDRLNVTIRVDDENIDPQGVFLLIRFPGDDSPSSIRMKQCEGNSFYAVAEVPMRTGTISFWFEVGDLAGISVTSDTYSVTVKMHFIDAAWPYLLAMAVAAAFATAAYFARESGIAVDETFVIYNDGRLMAHSTRRLKPGMDDQVLGSMFVAIQDFVRDSFKDDTSFTLRKLDFGSKSVLLERGENIFLAVVLHGKVSKKATRRMRRVVTEIEQEFSMDLIDWDGDLDKVRGVNDIMKKLYSRAPAFPGRLE